MQSELRFLSLNQVTSYRLPSGMADRIIPRRQWETNLKSYKLEIYVFTWRIWVDFTASNLKHNLNLIQI